MTPSLTCSSTELTIKKPLWALTQSQRTAVETWLLDHGIRPEKLVVGATISRDHARRRLSWFEVSEEGPAPRMFLRFGGPYPEWPAPFPDSLITE